MKLSKEKGTQRGQPKGHLDKKSSTELQQAKKKKTMCASATHESASSHEPDPKKNHPKEQTAGEVIKKSHKRKKPVSPTKDVSVTRVAEDVKCDDSGNTTGITDLKETNIGNVCVSSKKSSKASRNKKVKVENTTKVTRARSAYIFFVMEERIRVKEENNLDNKDVMKVREHFRTSMSLKVIHSKLLFFEILTIFWLFLAHTVFCSIIHYFFVDISVHAENCGGVECTIHRRQKSEHTMG